MYRKFVPFTIGRFTLIPAGEETPTPCELPIILGKKGAFGSGEHETTADCLELLPSIPGITGMRALDLGSGTGILAIAAVQLGAKEVVAIDIAWQAALSCQDNAERNNMTDRVFSVCGELSSLGTTDFDLVMANIYADIHLALADEMVAKTRQGGFLLLSGIPLQDKFDIYNRFTSSGCVMIDSRIGEEYVTYLLKRPTL